MSLHWILMVTVTLLHCFTAKPIPVKYFVNDIRRTIGDLQKTVCNETDATFYSPTGTNGCTIKALQCSVLELEKVGAECFDSETQMYQSVYRTRDNIKLLLKAINKTGQVDFKDCFCGEEKLPEKTYKEFLTNIWTLVQKLNSKVSDEAEKLQQSDSVAA